MVQLLQKGRTNSGAGFNRLRFSLDAYSPETYAKVRVGSVFLEK